MSVRLALRRVAYELIFLGIVRARGLLQTSLLYLLVKFLVELLDAFVCVCSFGQTFL